MKANVVSAQVVNKRFDDFSGNTTREGHASESWFGCARKFLRQWCTRTMRSKLEPMKKVARTLREHETLLMNWFEAHGQISRRLRMGSPNYVSNLIHA
jgi:hypothetical protein